MNVTRIEAGRTTSRGALCTCLLASVVVVGILSPAAAEAGSVFMKNGYIIQGRIVDQDADSVVLGWPNGKMAIAHRFVDSVVLEPDEEDRIRQLEEARQSEEVEEPEELSVLSEDDVDLPPTLEMFVRKYRVGGPKGLPGLGTLDETPLDRPDGGGDPIDMAGGDPTDTGNTGTDPTVVTDVRPLGPPRLGPRVSHAGTGAAIEPPDGWEAVGHEEILAFRAPAQGTGFRASLNVVSVDPAPLDRDQFVQLLHQENEGQLVGYELLIEEATTVAGQPAFRVVGRGTYGGHTAIVDQRLLVTGGKLWLVSVFRPEEADEGLENTVEAALASLQVEIESSAGPE